MISILASLFWNTLYICTHELTLIVQQYVDSYSTGFSSFIIMSTQLEFEKKAAEERMKRAEMYYSSLEERAREQATQLAEARDKESQHRATAAQMRFGVVSCFNLI